MTEDNKKLNSEEDTKKYIIDHIVTASDLVEKSTNDILSLLRNMEAKLENNLDSPSLIELKKLILEMYEICTFEDIVNQHLKKAQIMAEQSKLSGSEKNCDPFLSGPCVKGETTLLQSDIDKMLDD